MKALPVQSAYAEVHTCKRLTCRMTLNQVRSKRRGDGAQDRDRLECLYQEEGTVKADREAAISIS